MNKDKTTKVVTGKKMEDNVHVGSHFCGVCGNGMGQPYPVPHEVVNIAVP